MKKILFFGNPFYTKLTEGLASDKFTAIYATLEHKQAEIIINRGDIMVGCFEDLFDTIPVVDVIDPNYLHTCFASDRYLQRFPLDKRYEILGKEIVFWRAILEEHRPDFIVNETITLEFTEVLEIEASKLGIHYYSFLPNFLPNTFYWKDSPYNSQFNDLLGEVTCKHVQLANEYINKIRNEEEKPFFVRDLKKYSHFSNLKRIVTNTIPHYLYYRLQEIRHSGFKYISNSMEAKWTLKRQISLLYNNYDRPQWDDTKEYVFYPLHFEPEATLSYFVDPYVDQSVVIETIARALKTNQVLIVKEHPQQLGALFEKKYQLIKKRNSNILYLSGEITSEEVSRHTSLLVTLTGTAGWEAYIRKKRVIVLGNVFYDKFHGVNKCSLSELKDYIRNDKFLEFNDDDVLQAVSFMMSRAKVGSPYPYKFVSWEQKRSDLKNRIEEIIS